MSLGFLGYIKSETVQEELCMFFSVVKKESSKAKKIRARMNGLKERLCRAIETMAHYSSWSLPLELAGFHGMFWGGVPMPY